ncbi:hypothetical protein [Agrobacterium vaccinii]|uniref:hypothetical protein n=1 Tax=Agrobacterium vaccinii TaxID=2735528 RepID=UPI001E57A93B|nr:hypothetical protein [Agrobacterium vaccinii]UHS57158.1 hypothetical protein HRS00_10245 [Agrobacterium vaccinii]
MTPQVQITDDAIWFKHIHGETLRERLRKLRENEQINLEADGVVGEWVRMKTGSDGRPTDGIRPQGEMKMVWSNWYRKRKGERISLREVKLADDYLVNIASLFPEWESAEDEEAFRDL